MSNNNFGRAFMTFSYRSFATGEFSQPDSIKKSPRSTGRIAEIAWPHDKFATDLIQDSAALP
ncbi:hypothetical protein [Dechloromonas denitrificans]|uniref:hypothetical protein n=1 Tax=Dechloromonas denitrificans TaxID=281362 RepID=UPI001CF8D1D1|nr:hypothetical protein [Dechloromonas denitrificans]UCV01977.1 hypothetical protein KI611_12750 [Dechloromonas denitrificans]